VHAKLASEHGIATLALNYRCSIGYGLNYMGLPHSCPDNSEQFDILGAAEYLMASPLFDSADGLGIHGLSYGAWNAYTALAFYPDLFSVGVGVSGVSNRAAQQPFVADRDAMAGGRNVLAHTLLPQGDLIKYGPFPDINFPGWPQRAENNMNYLFEKSPISQLAQWTVPTLIICNGDDSEVPVSQSIALFHQLQAIGTEAEFHINPEAVHDGSTEESFRITGQLTVDYLVKHLITSPQTLAQRQQGKKQRVQTKRRSLQLQGEAEAEQEVVAVEEGAYPFCSYEDDATSTSGSASGGSDDSFEDLPVWAIVVIVMLATTVGIFFLLFVGLIYRGGGTNKAPLASQDNVHGQKRSSYES
jgi:hypothetical protein